MSESESSNKFLELCDGVGFRYIGKQHFKHSILSISFYLPLDIERASANALSANILRSSSGRYPNALSFARQLAMYYGAGISSEIHEEYNYQVVEFQVSMLDDYYIPHGEKILLPCAELLYDMIFKPNRNADGELFSSDVIESARQSLIQKINSSKSNKSDYALQRCFEAMCEGEPYSIHELGDIEHLNKADSRELEEAWQYMLKKAHVEIIMIGRSDCNDVAELFRQGFLRLEREPIEISRDIINKEITEKQRLVERSDIRQSQLVVGMRTDFSSQGNQGIAARLMATLLGKGVNSLLFKNLREKQGLCYSCRSKYIRSRGLFFVSAGINEESLDKAVNEISKQIKAITDNSFSDDELLSAKKALAHEILEMNDSVHYLKKWYSFNSLDEISLTPEQYIERLMDISREMVAECAASLKLDTIYLLAPHLSENSGGEEHDG